MLSRYQGDLENLREALIPSEHSPFQTDADRACQVLLALQFHSDISVAC